jgi:glycerol 2-dehydrogenase (NADP+)
LGSTNSPLYEDPAVLDIARTKGKTAQQCLLQWGIQSGWDVIPKSVTKERIESNFALDDWSLNDTEMAVLTNLKGRFKVCGDSWLPAKVFFGDDE